MTVSGTKKKASLAERLSQNSVFLSGAALVLSLIVAGIVMLIAGYSPIEGYSAMFTGAFGNVSNLAQTLGTATPLIFAGLAMAFAARGGMFNIGIEGQIIAGAFPAALVGAYVQGLPWFLHIPLCFLAGMIGGGVWAAIAGFLKNKLRVSEVILTIMLNYVAQYLAEYLANYQFKAEGMLVRTETILPSAALTPLVPYTRLTGGIFVALAFAVLMWWFLSRTTAGYQIRAISANPYAAEAGGINIARMNLLTMFLSGALAGMGGFVYALTTANCTSNGDVAGFGFLALAVMIFGNWKPLNIAGGALLFGLFKCIAAAYTSIDINGDGVFLLAELGISANFYRMLPYLITLIVLAFTSKSSRAPKAEGIPYDKAKR